MSFVFERVVAKVVQAMYPSYKVGRQWGKRGGQAYDIDVLAIR